MDKNKIKSLEQLNIFLNEDKIKLFDEYERIFLEKNSLINLISKNDEKFLFEKHIFDSLAINLVKPFNNDASLLDIGTGGGFPAVPITILYDEINVFAVDSIRKKIKVVEEIKETLGLRNLFPVCDRVENIRQEFDYITTRAVAPLDVILKYAIPHLKKGGYFIAYKSKKVSDEIKQAEKTIKSQKIKLTFIHHSPFTIHLLKHSAAFCRAKITVPFL
ncbi:MAG: 16S rRNA (guanine(527)-N(7))-methyltransferase RsmG [Candidatus Gastranaerophilales bacterium]|nr:16S rRNA (guanine(527)-N(7))-methyltransferase RsmG [Candidatus Gastranaerophilales bacterium]